MKNDKKPQVRFKGFNDDWEQRKVGEFLTESRESGHKGDVAHKMTVKLWGKGVYEKNETGSTNTQYFTRHAGQFIYSKLDFLNCAFGVVPEELDSLETTADVPAFDCDGVNSYFMFYTAIQPIFYEKNGMIADGSRKAKRIHANTFLEMPFFVPSLTEQNKIVNLLSELNHLITLHQRKCDKLQKIKKSMLEKMFPQNGMKKPEIRFKGFNDDWEQRKLSDVAGVYDGVHQTPDYQDEGIMFLSVENIASLTSEKYISEEAYERDYKVRPEKGDILMTRIGDVGTPNVVETDKKLAYYVSLALLKPKGIDSYFLNNAIQSSAFQQGLRERTLLTAIPMKINKDEIGKVDISFPADANEQCKIGESLKRLDNLITLHQRKLEKLKYIKKSMLENMFV